MEPVVGGADDEPRALRVDVKAPALRAEVRERLRAVRVATSQATHGALIEQVTSRLFRSADARMGVEGFIVSTNAASVTWSLCPRRRHRPVSATTSQTTTLVSLPPETSNDPDALNLRSPPTCAP